MLQSHGKGGGVAGSTQLVDCTMEPELTTADGSLGSGMWLLGFVQRATGRRGRGYNVIDDRDLTTFVLGWSSLWVH